MVNRELTAQTSDNPDHIDRGSIHQMLSNAVTIADATENPLAPPRDRDGERAARGNSQPDLSNERSHRESGGTQPIRVCFLIDRLRLGGTETQLLALIRHLDKSRVYPYLALLDGEDEGSRTGAARDCQILNLGMRHFLHSSALRSLWRFRRFLRQQRIDVLQMYFPDSTYFGTLAGNLAGVPCIVRTRNNSNYWMTPHHRWLGRFMNRFVTVTVCNCDASRHAVLSDEKPCPETVHVIENSVDVDRFADIRPLGATRDADDPFRVGMVANLRVIKRHDVLLRAAARVVQIYPDVEFVLAGDGPERENLERLAHELGLGDRVQFHGLVTDIPSFLARLDVAVLSSDSEGMSNTLLEYMAAARAIVATDVGSASRLIEDGVHGRLIEPNHEIALASGIVEYQADRTRARAAGLAARERVLEKFERRGMAERFTNFYEALVQAKRHGQ